MQHRVSLIWHTIWDKTMNFWVRCPFLSLTLSVLLTQQQKQEYLTPWDENKLVYNRCFFKCYSTPLYNVPKPAFHSFWKMGLCGYFCYAFFLNCSFDTKSCVQMVQISLSWDIEFQTWNWYLGNYAKLKGTSFKIKIQTIKLQICLLPAVLVSWHHISVLIWLVR